jgi:hypothetical protein
MENRDTRVRMSGRNGAGPLPAPRGGIGTAWLRDAGPEGRYSGGGGGGRLGRGRMRGAWGVVLELVPFVVCATAGARNAGYGSGESEMSMSVDRVGLCGTKAFSNSVIDGTDNVE